MTESKLVKFLLTVPKELLEEYDEAWRRKHYKTRDEPLCQFMRDFNEKDKAARKQFHNPLYLFESSDLQEVKQT